MIIGIPKEIKNNEYRVALTPAGAHALAGAGHRVLIARDAGAGSGFGDGEYTAMGAETADDNRDVFAQADIIVKVKEPLESEYELLRDGQVLFTYLHLASCRPLTEALLRRGVTAIGYETVQLPDGSLPLLSPMSEVAGRMAVQIGANLLQKQNGGSGVMLGGVPGVLPAEVLIIGGGVVGANAAKMAAGLGAHVVVMDISRSRLVYLDEIFGGRVNTLDFDRYTAEAMVGKADLLIGAVLVAGQKAPKVISEEMVMQMKKGSVIVDVAIDQGGCIATIDRVTTHDNPSYEKYGVIHYSVANIPGCVPRTSTLALTGMTLPYLFEIAGQGAVQAMQNDPALLAGLNTYQGAVTCRGVSDSLGLPYADPAGLLAAVR
ncbi:MAG: alanine dehydrogenase [Saccharofermentanales bacterium]